jgi:hypothetical protein
MITGQAIIGCVIAEGCAGVQHPTALGVALDLTAHAVGFPPGAAGKFEECGALPPCELDGCVYRVLLPLAVCLALGDAVNLQLFPLNTVVPGRMMDLRLFEPALPGHDRKPLHEAEATALAWLSINGAAR